MLIGILLICIVGIACAIAILMRNGTRNRAALHALAGAITFAPGVHVQLVNPTITDEHRGFLRIAGNAAATVIDMDGRPTRYIRATGVILDVPLPAHLVATAELDGLAAIDIHLTSGGVDTVHVRTRSGATGSHAYA